MFDHEQNKLLRKILEVLERIERKLFHRAVRARLTYSIQGECRMATTPLALIVGQTANPTFLEFDAAGDSEPIVGPVTYAADSSGAVSVDPNSGVATAVNPTDAGSVATVTATDASNSLSASASFTVSPATPPVAVSATLSYTANPLPAAVRKAVRG